MNDKLYDLSIYKLFNNKKIFIAIFIIFVSVGIQKL